MVDRKADGRITFPNTGEEKKTLITENLREYEKRAKEASYISTWLGKHTETKKWTRLGGNMYEKKNSSIVYGNSYGNNFICRLWKR